VTASLQHDSHPYALPVSPVFNPNFFRFSQPTVEIQGMLTSMTARKEEKKRKEKKRKGIDSWYITG
jgi:hypothetical protein